MKPFRDYAIRHKLTLAFLAASITPLLTGVGLFLVYEQAGQRAQIVEASAHVERRPIRGTHQGEVDRDATRMG